MCGLAGFYAPTGMNEERGKADLVAMIDLLVHRGPDDVGIWQDAEAGIAMGHRRLSILDLSAAGHQPMSSASGRFVMAFNGEIYNHLQLRRQLEASGVISWRGSSDTETLLASIEEWGLETTLESSVGMFAFALWDRKERTISLARDRVGEKPLYYGWQGGVLYFSSELKAIRAHPGFNAEIDNDVISLYVRHGYIPAPWSIVKGIRKLVPGTIIVFTAEHGDDLPLPSTYWSLEQAIAQGQAEPFEGSGKEAIDALEMQLRRAIADQSIADVPLGAFLSGGIDSSTVVALMQAQANCPVKTFSIGFDEAHYDEAQHAKAVAHYLGTDHTELYVTSTQAREVVPVLPQIYDEPFGDSSAIPTFLVSRLARQHVTVSLSGDGGDEIFGGYTRYFNRKAESRWRASKMVPEKLRPLARAFILKSALLNPSLSRKVVLFADLMDCNTHFEFYQRMITHWDPESVCKKPRSLTYGYPSAKIEQIPETVHQMMAFDTVTYLPDDILVKVDRAGMAVSLETRVPLLDHRVIELAWKMPYRFKFSEGRGKHLLQQVLYRYVPRHLIDRPKMGFGVPVDAWLIGPLREWAEELLSPTRLRVQGYLNEKEVRLRWRQHTHREQNWRDSIWIVLMWQAWLEQFENDK